MQPFRTTPSESRLAASRERVLLTSSTIIEKGQYISLRTLGIIVCALCMTVQPAVAADAATLLNCTITCISNCASSGPPLAVTLHIDKGHKTVTDAEQSYSADVGQTFIVWDERYVGRFSLNRSTLGLSEATFNSPDGTDFNLLAPIYQGPCKKGSNQI